MQKPVKRQYDYDSEKKYFWLQVVPIPSYYNCKFEPYVGRPIAPCQHI